MAHGDGEVDAGDTHADSQLVGAHCPACGLGVMVTIERKPGAKYAIRFGTMRSAPLGQDVLFDEKSCLKNGR